MAWACRYHRRIFWPPGAFLRPGDPTPLPMIQFLKKEHFEPMHAQMEHKEHGKISLKSVSQLTDIPTYKSTMSMSKHIQDFESYLSTHYGVEEFPLDYVVRPKLAHLPWITMRPQNLRGNVHNAFPDFFQVDETDYNSRHFARMVSDREPLHMDLQSDRIGLAGDWY